jgi:hypothetical protein
MIRRFVLGAAVGLLAAMLATPVQAAEWCVDDPALTFDAPHAHKLTLYLTEGVQGSKHVSALRDAHHDLKTTPGKATGAVDLQIRVKIHGHDRESFSTMMMVSSAPFGAGTNYGMVTGTSDHEMVLHFTMVYQPDDR